MPDVLDLLVDSANHTMKNWTPKKLGGCQIANKDAWVVSMQHTRRVSQT